MRECPNSRQFQRTHSFIVLIDIDAQHVEGKLTLNQLLILAAVWEAGLKGHLLSVPDIANRRDLPSSTEPSKEV